MSLKKVKFFLVHLLALLAGWLCFYLGVALTIDLIVGLAIGRAELIGRKVTVVFFELFLWKKLINFLRCQTTNNGSQVFFSSG